MPAARLHTAGGAPPPPPSPCPERAAARAPPARMMAAARAHTSLKQRALLASVSVLASITVRQSPAIGAASVSAKIGKAASIVGGRFHGRRWCLWQLTPPSRRAASSREWPWERARGRGDRPPTRCGPQTSQSCTGMHMPCTCHAHICTMHVPCICHAPTIFHGAQAVRVRGEGATSGHGRRRAN